MNKKHYVYILKCSDGTYYTGYTTDPERRPKRASVNDARFAAVIAVLRQSNPGISAIRGFLFYVAFSPHHVLQYQGRGCGHKYVKDSRKYCRHSVHISYAVSRQSK